jgi:hypothetical protein
MPPRDGIEYRLWRHALGDGEVTTLYAVLYPRRSTRARVLHFPRAERLDVWCRTNGVEEAFVGGFYLRDPYRPLGELWVDGRPVPHEPVAAPYAERRGSVVIEDREVQLVERAACDLEEAIPGAARRRPVLLPQRPGPGHDPADVRHHVPAHARRADPARRRGHRAAERVRSRLRPAPTGAFLRGGPGSPSREEDRRRGRPMNTDAIQRRR